MSVLEEIRYTHSLQQHSVTREMVAEEFATLESDFDKGYALDQIIGHLELDKKHGQELLPTFSVILGSLLQDLPAVISRMSSSLHTIQTKPKEIPCMSKI